MQVVGSDITEAVPSYELRAVRRGALNDMWVRTRPEVVVVSAPAGYGKSTLLRQWAAGDPRRTVWLDVTDEHDDAGALMAAARDVVGDPSGPYILVLDDLQHASSRAALNAVKQIATDLPEGCALVCASRDTPELALGMVRATRNVIDVDLQQLAMEVDEASLLFAAENVDVAKEVLRALVDRVEGWPAALRIAAVGASHAADQTAAVTEFAGDNRQLAELLNAEVVGRLTQQDVDFLLAIADLPRVSGALCDFVLERTGSAALLQRLAAETLLVLPLDQRRTWYRLHNVLQTFLRSDVPGRGQAVPEVLARGSQWFEKFGDVDAAISLAARGNDAQRATDLVLAHFAAKVGSGDPLTVKQWLDRLHQDNVPTTASLEAVSALVHLGIGDPDGTLRCVQRAEFGLSEPFPQDGEFEQAAACVAALRALVGWNCAQDMRVNARYTRRHTKSRVWHAFASFTDGGSSFLLGDLGDAEEALLISGALGETISFTTWTASFSLLALVYDRSGQRPKAVASARRAKQLAVDLQLLEIPHLYLVWLISAYFEALDGSIDLAEIDVERCLAQRARCSGLAPWSQLLSSILLAHIAHLRNDPQQKAKWLREADSLLLVLPDALLAKAMIAEVRSLVSVTSGSDDLVSALSTAELRVLQYLPTHLSLAEIADKLYLSRHTVKAHVVAVYRKLNAANRNEAVEKAKRAGLLTVD